MKILSWKSLIILLPVCGVWLPDFFFIISLLIRLLTHRALSLLRRGTFQRLLVEMNWMWCMPLVCRSSIILPEWKFKLGDQSLPISCLRLNRLLIMMLRLLMSLSIKRRSHWNLNCKFSLVNWFVRLSLLLLKVLLFSYRCFVLDWGQFWDQVFFVLT